MKKYLTLVLIFIFASSCENNSVDKVVIRKSADSEVLFYNNYGEFKDSIASVTFDKALDQIRKKQFGKAKKLLLEANKTEPNNKIILNGLGNIEKDLKNFEKASEYFEKAILIDSVFGITYLNYGTSCNQNNKENKAIQIYKKGIEVETDNYRRAALFYGIAVSHYRVKNYDSAVYFNEKGLVLVSEPELKKDMIRLNKLILNN